MVICARSCTRKGSFSKPLKKWSSGRAQHLLFATRHNVVLSVFGVRLDLNALLTARSCHCERPYLCAVVLADFLLFSVKSYTFAYQVSATITPHVEWHFKPAQSAWC